ncbi:cell death regulator Aven isoform X2 [Brachyhypopomus gauderio]|uniref:cell death regulator Aven isoform X2 n=1 Tax=Brachyhypopomus gauderio TaxID=698409 RepID=UPI00404212DE
MGYGGCFFPGHVLPLLLLLGQDDENDKENYEEEISDVYPRRKLESNWDRYEESEKEEVNDGVPVQRGTDYHVLLSSAGDSFTQFRFAEEKDWELDSLAANQVPAIAVDLEALAQSLQELPMHKRLNLEAEIVQVTTPVELPLVGVLNKVELSASSGFKPSAPSRICKEPGLGDPRPFKTLSDPGMSSTAVAVEAPIDDEDEELNLLLGLQKPVAELPSSESKTSGAVEEVSVSLEKASVVEEKKEDLVEANPIMEEEEPRQNAEEPKNEADSAKQEMTDEDLEDWLDSMIS